MIRNKWGVRVAAMAALVGAAGVARADDEKIYPGALCQPRASGEPVRRTTAGMFNSGTPFQAGWICPLTRDWVSNDIDAGWVKYFDLDPGPGPAHQVTCALTLVAENNPDRLLVVARSSSGTGAGVLRFGRIETSGFGAEGAYLFDCDVPGQVTGSERDGRSGISAYSITEQ